MTREPVYEGHALTIRCLEFVGGSESDRCPAGYFLDNLSDKDYQKVYAICEMLGDQGYVSNEEKFKRIEDSDKIFEIKSFQIRILGFHTPDKEFMLGFGLIKKKDKHKKGDIKRAENMKRSYFEARKERR